MNELAILLATFVSVLIVSALVLNFIYARKEVVARIESTDADELFLPIPENIRGLPVSEVELIRNYFTVIRSDKNPNSLQNRLIRAGYFSKNSVKVYHFIRFTVTFFLFWSSMLILGYLLPELSRSTFFIISLIIAGFSFFLCNIILERRGDKREIEYRKYFPDFMDTLIVCLDAGLSVEAAVDRVSLEFMKSSKKDFGLHLAIMMLEVRGGRRFRDALSNFAKRLRIEEAQSLAVLFRQSEELGSSVTKTLRVFSQEMRDRRMIRAEEKANTLPLRMLFPLAIFLFPMSILIVLVPILLKVIMVLRSISP
jgi:tight adherence protein C